MIRKSETHSGKKAEFSTNGSAQTGQMHGEKCKTIHTYHCTNLKSKRTKDLNINADILILIEKSGEYA